MSITEDLINFDIIETQKENIQSLPQGRSAKALAAQFGPSPFSPLPTPGATRTLNDAIRQEYEVELQSIADADDPLDIYDRYIKWTINAYPSAQATSDSQLRPLLERATKTFQGSAQYKNDVRYLRMWLNYIRFFSDAPREVYAYLSRHGIGDSLALFYEEFAAWLESAGRWSQAEEIYRLGIEKEARPIERLMRKYAEFQKRSENRIQNVDEPSSPALPTVRPALAAKIDPFASSASADPQGRSGLPANAASKKARSKMAIFSDSSAATAESSSRPGSGDKSKGWDSIGTMAERRKENTIEARPWAGETMKAGKKANASKMMVFKDDSTRQPRGIVISSRNGKTERWFADILSVCPNEANSKDEYCFEEIRARHRGWLNRDWRREEQLHPAKATCGSGRVPGAIGDGAMLAGGLRAQSKDDKKLVSAGYEASERDGKPRKTKVMEIKAEAQTVKAVLDSPVKKTKVKRKKSSEATMTLHTKAATDDVLDLFNQPLRNVGPIGSKADSDGDTTDYDPDDYTCGVSSVGDNTRTDIMSDSGSIYNDEDTDNQTESGATESQRHDSVSPWSDLSTARHVPDVDTQQIEALESCKRQGDHKRALDSRLTQLESSDKFVPAPPDGVEVSTMPFKTAEEAAQSRLPFMTPIVEMTESSLGFSTVRRDREAQYAKTPSRRKGDATETIHEIATPLQEILNDEHLSKRMLQSSLNDRSAEFKAAVFEDGQLNPHDTSVRDMIMREARLSSFFTYNDHRQTTFNMTGEIRRFIKSLTISARSSSGEVEAPCPVLQFPTSNVDYIVQKELGRGAYAPVYLAAVDATDDLSSSSSLVAVKCEDPPSAWEYYILSVLHERLEGMRSDRVIKSITRPLAFHHFADEVYLLESYHNQGTLLDLVNLVRAEPSLTSVNNAAASLPGMDESVAMFFAIELLRSLGGMHAAGIIHGDVKADNCLLRVESVDQGLWTARYDAEGDGKWSQKGLSLIDFGRGIDMTVFRKDVGFVADWETSKDDCVEMRELRPWTYQVDYWGAAGVLHVLLFGKWIEDVVAGTGRRSYGASGNMDRTVSIGRAGVQRRVLKESLKRYWQTELWSDVFDMLMNPTFWLDDENSGSLLASKRLREVTSALEGWLEENSEKKGLKTQLWRLEERIRDRRRKE